MKTTKKIQKTKTKKLTYALLDGVEQNKQHPTTFYIPTEKEKKEVKPGVYVKLVFQSTEKKTKNTIHSERMWVQVTKVNKTGLNGTLANDPIILPNLKFNDTIKFEPKHIINILNK